MNIIPCFFLLLLLILAQDIHAQSPSPSPGATKPTEKTVPPSQTLSSSARPQESDEEDVVRVNTTLVTVPVSVMDRNGKYILDLRREDFRLYEDGAEQEIANFDSTEKPFTIALLLDISDSMRFRIEDIQAAATVFVNQLRQEDRVMVIAFDSQVRILAEPTTNHNLARDAIRRTSMGGGTRVYDAINFVLNQRFNNIRGRKAVILFTDGVDTGSFQASFKDNQRDAEESDVLIYPVQYSTSKDLNDQLRAGLSSPSGGSVMLPSGNGTSMDTARAGSYLRALSQKTGARLYRVDDAQDLTRSFTRIAGELRQQYSLSYYPKAPAQSGQRREIKVRINGQGLSVRARSSYISGTTDIRQHDPRQGAIPRPRKQ
jgi:VWFA-related protein